MKLGSKKRNPGSDDHLRQVQEKGISTADTGGNPRTKKLDEKAGSRRSLRSSDLRGKKFLSISAKKKEKKKGVLRRRNYQKTTGPLAVKGQNRHSEIAHWGKKGGTRDCEKEQLNQQKTQHQKESLTNHSKTGITQLASSRKKNLTYKGAPIGEGLHNRSCAVPIQKRKRPTERKEGGARKR